jgi:hypothetical protein
MYINKTPSAITGNGEKGGIFLFDGTCRGNGQEKQGSLEQAHKGSLSVQNG